MMSFVYLASALLLGFAITKRLGLRLLAFEGPALAISLGLVFWIWLSLLTALLLPYSLSLPLSIFIAALASFWLLRGAPQRPKLPLPGGRPAWIAWAIFSSVTTALLTYLMFTHDLKPSPDGLYSANATWADFGLHTSLISHFAANTHLSLDFPVAAGAHLTYPFMIDLLSAWLVRGGWSLQWALLVPGVLLAVAFLQLMLGFGVRRFGSLGGMIIGLTLMLLCGSAVGAQVALSDWHLSSLSLSQFLGHLPQDYTIPASPNAQVTNFLADAILPQRAFSMGLAVFGAVLILVTELRRGHQPIRLAVFTGVLIGLLPLIHAHTFVILMALVASFWFEAGLTSHNWRSQWLTVALAGLLVALPQVAWQSLATPGGTGGYFSPGWVIMPGESIISFWSHNYGLTGILIMLLVALFLWRRGLHQYLSWYMPLVVVFIAANLYALQPFAYDNLKLIYYVYLMTYVFAGYLALRLARRWSLVAIPLGAIGLILCSSGSLAVAREFQHQDQFASTDDIAVAAWATQHTSPNTVFVATDKPNQPVATLAGRSIVLGYRGWLYDYHLNYQPRVATVQAALNGQLTTANPYHATYLIVAPSEPSDWSVDQAALLANYQTVYANSSWTVYQLSKP